MAREPRDAVVSLRISDDEHSRLRQAAEARGVSVSALVRAIVTREVSGGPRAVETETIGSPSQGQAGHGIFWDVQSGMTVAGGTLTISSGGLVKSRE
jgi:Mobilization protein NikA